MNGRYRARANAQITEKVRAEAIAPIALGQLHLLETVLEFQRQHPSIALDWHLQDDNIRFAEVGCDCWIKIGSVPDGALTVEPLGQVEHLVVAAPKLLQHHFQPQTPAALEKLPFISLIPFEGGRIPLSQAEERPIVISPSARMTTNSITALRKATLAGLGAAVMPRWFIEEDLQAQQLIDLLPQWRAPRLTINVATLPGRHRPRRLTKFLEALRTGVGVWGAVER